MMEMGDKFKMFVDFYSQNFYDIEGEEVSKEIGKLNFSNFF